VQGWAYLKLDKCEYYSLQEPTNTKLRNISYGKINLELETIIKIGMQIHVPQLRSITAKSSGEQTSMKAYNVITWNSFIALQACPIRD